jgi:hypothetical protein
MMAATVEPFGLSTPISSADGFLGHVGGSD